MIRDDLFFRLYEDLQHAPVIDTHEHLPPPQANGDQPQDVLSEYLAHYMSSDLVSAGLSLEGLDYARDAGKPIESRWRKVEPFWQACRYTGYARALDRSINILYGLDGLQRHTLLALQQAFLEANRPGRRHEVMQKICGIEACLNDGFQDDPSTLPCDPVDGMLPVWRPDDYFHRTYDAAGLQKLCQRHGLETLTTLADFLQLMEADVAILAEKKLKAIKIGTAYDRSLYFPQTRRADAARAFKDFVQRLKKDAKTRLPLPESVQNFMLHEILKQAGEKNLVVQVHTGLQEGHGNLLQNSQPLLLSELLLQHPGVHFDLFHVGYPFIGETCALAKNFANVSIDMCWSHIIAPVAARRALAEFLDAVPASKISAFGGDYLFVDGIAGHLSMAKENVAAVLAAKVREAVMEEDQARILGRRLFYDHPKKIFDL